MRIIYAYAMRTAPYGETPLGRKFIAGMRDVVRHVRGEIDLPIRTAVSPEARSGRSLP